MIGYKVFLATFVVWICDASSNQEVPTCPRECTCEMSALRNAPFVLTWMTSWGEDSLPEVNPNEVYDAGYMVFSETAADANVNVEQVGLHATCSLHPTTNTSVLLSALPASTMVLTLMQAPGCNLTILDGGQLVNLNALTALHLQGYAHRYRKQVSGFTPNRGPEVVAHQQLMQHELTNGPERTSDLRLALAEDALQSLTSLQLLDIQYVRLVAAKDVRRLRRSRDPIFRKTVVDLPLGQFLALARRLEGLQLPAHLDYPINEYGAEYDQSNQLDNTLTLEESYPQGMEDINVYEHYNQKQDAFSINSIRSEASTFLLPYKYYKEQLQPQLAPFKSLRILKYLRVAHAQLDRIGPELLDGLTKLHTLTLEYNKIDRIPERVFDSSPSIRHLSLAHNNILTIDSQSFIDLHQLQTLDLDFNNLTVIGAASLPELPSLIALRVDGNPLVQVLPGAFASLNATEKLYLGSSNVSMDIHIDSFRALPFLTTLVLQNITMTSLKKGLLTGMPRLQELTLHGHIPQILYDAFSQTSSINSLDLSHCQLEKLSMDAFFELHTLRILDLSHNNLANLPPGLFDHVVNLRELYLHNNQLTTLPLGIFLPIPAKLIQLNENPWECTCDLLQLRPSVTNKIKKSGSVVCRWDEKLATVCSKSKDRLMYNARVAPLCSTPRKFEGNNVYHVALRHLKCRKYHWVPMLPETAITSKTTPKIKHDVIDRKEKEESVKASRWLPLTAFTPEPAPLQDLLAIAEMEDLEEVIETTTSKNTTTDNPTNAILRDEASVSPQKKRIHFFTKEALIERRRMRSKASKQTFNKKRLQMKRIDRRMAKKKLKKSLLKSQIRDQQKLLKYKKLQYLKKQKLASKS